MSESIKVTGVGEVRRMPDLAVINYKICARSPSPAGAEREVGRIYEEFTAAAADSLKDCVVHSDRQSVMPVYEFEGGRQNLTDYEGLRNISIKIRDFSLIPLINTLAFDSGVNQLTGIEYMLENTAEFEDEAARLAVKDAYHQARLMAESFDVSLGRAVRISFYRQSRGSPLRLMRASVVSAGASDAALFDPEPVVISASVDAEFLMDKSAD